jgi:hypothetical protein
MTPPGRISKILTANDVGDTGAHQAGILVPKAPPVLAFFPALDKRERNPRVLLTFRDDDGFTRWEFAFIYYNNSLFGGTRNEYRLTRMTKYLRSKNAKPGDEVVLTRGDEGRLFVDCRRSTPLVESDGVLHLTGGWKIIPIK